MGEFSRPLPRAESKPSMDGAPPEAGGLPENATKDYFLDGRLQIFQPQNGPRLSIDALFLAAGVPELGGFNGRVLEAGAGTGAVSLLLARRAPNAQFLAVEREPDLLQFLQENIKANGFQARISAVQADLTRPAKELRALGLKPEAFDHVVANPPFYSQGTVRVPPQVAKAGAHSAAPGNLAVWVKFLDRMCVAKGRITLIFNAEGLAELLAALKGRFGGLEIFPLYPKKGSPARRVVVGGEKGSRSPLRIYQGLVLHNADGSYTSEAQAVLREGKLLAFGKPTRNRPHGRVTG